MGLTLAELKHIERILKLDYAHQADRQFALDLMAREIKLKTLNPVTGEYEEGKDTGGNSNTPDS